jgi:hypothetical protein
MKTTIGVLSLLLVLAIAGVVASKELHQMTTSAGGSSAVIYATTSSTPSLQQSQQNREHTVEGAVPQGRPESDSK